MHWLVDDLGYTYLGNLEDIDNMPVKEELLKTNLKKRGYAGDQIVIEARFCTLFGMENTPCKLIVQGYLF